MKIRFPRIFSKLKTKEIKQARQEATTKNPAIKNEQDYFKAAKSWADDIYTATIVSRNRYRAAFLSMSGLAALLVVCVLMLVPLQHTELVVVHQGLSGDTWLTTAKQQPISPNWARTQAEIAYYVRMRESYDPLLYRYQTDQVKLMSTPQVQADYELAQSSANRSAPINVLGNQGYRTVTIHDVLPLDSAADNQNGNGKHVNLAQVNYVTVDHLFGQNATTTTSYTALVSWEYKGTPSDPADMLRDWDGFTITKFVVQPDNVGNNDST